MSDQKRSRHKISVDEANAEQFLNKIPSALLELQKRGFLLSRKEQLEVDQLFEPIKDDEREEQQETSFGSNVLNIFERHEKKLANALTGIYKTSIKSSSSSSLQNDFSSESEINSQSASSIRGVNSQSTSSIGGVNSQITSSIGGVNSQSTSSIGGVDSQSASSIGGVNSQSISSIGGINSQSISSVLNEQTWNRLGHRGASVASDESVRVPIRTFSEPGNVLSLLSNGKVDKILGENGTMNFQFPEFKSPKPTKAKIEIGKLIEQVNIHAQDVSGGSQQLVKVLKEKLVEILKDELDTRY